MQKALSGTPRRINKKENFNLELDRILTLMLWGTMSLSAQNDILHDEAKAQKYLSKNCLKNNHRHCPRCNQRKHYRLKDGRRRCSRCKYTFHDFSGRWINSGRLTAVQWLSLIRYFTEELSALKAAGGMGLSYNTVLNAFNILRYAILAHAGDAVDFFCRKTGHVKCCYGGKWTCDNRHCLIEDVPVFGIVEEGGRVRIDIVPDITPGAMIRSNVKNLRRGSIVYTDRFMDYDSLLYYGYHHAMVKSDDHYPLDYVYINRVKGFWTWARDRFIKYFGVSSLNFPLYIKELEFRYNHRDKDIFQIIAKYMCDVMPMVDKGTVQ
jgi:transposase